MKPFIITLFLVLGSILPFSLVYAEEKKPTYSIQQLKPGIYRTQSDFHFGVVLEGKDSLLVFDTINKGFSTWLKKELKARFNKPVKYVVYSHSHADHVEGGQVFEKDNPIYISHRRAKQVFEILGVDTRLPNITFDKAMQVDLDGLSVHLQYWGANNGSGSISLYVPQKKFFSAVDWVLADRVGFKTMRGYDFNGLIHSLKEIDKLDWDMVAPGHSGVGTKEGVRLYRRYMETIRDNVLNGFRAKQSKAEIIATTKAKLDQEPAFRERLKMYDEWVEDNIRGAYNQLGNVESLTPLE